MRWNVSSWNVRTSRRALPLTIGVSLVVVLTCLALMISQGAASQAVAANARVLHWTNSVLGSAAIARAGNAQAVVFAVDHELGVAGAPALRIALAEAQETLDGLRQTVAVEPSEERLADPEIGVELAAFALSAEKVLSLIESERVEEAVELSQGKFELDYANLETVLIGEQDRLAGFIDQTEGELGRVASLARVLVSLLIPAAAVFVYFMLARRQVRDKRVALEAELEAERQISRAKDEFIAGLSHELRTPLTSIYGFSEMLIETGLVDPRNSMELITLINRESSELSRMVDDLLASARLGSDALSIELSDVALLPEIQNVLAPFLRSGRTVDVGGSPLSVRADPLRLRQAIRNLVSNAIRHGGPNVSIDVRPVDEKVILSVIDDGEGVPKELETRLFDRFVHRGHKALLTGSIGLGLSIARSLVEAMDGSINYLRANNHTVFTILLPAATGEAAKTLTVAPVTRIYDLRRDPIANLARSNGR